MVYMLSQEVDYESLRRGASPLPEVETAFPRLYGRALIVPAPGQCLDYILTSDLRFVSIRVHNAGGAPAAVERVEVSVPWLGPPPGAVMLEPDGRAAEIRLSFYPLTPLAAGRHTARVVLRLAGEGLRRHRLEVPIRLEVPDTAVPWFDTPELAFGGPYQEITVSFRSRRDVAVYYGSHLVEKASGERPVKLFPGEYRVEAQPGEQVMVRFGGRDPVTLKSPFPFHVGGPFQTVTLRNAGPRPLQGRLTAGAAWLKLFPDMIDLSPGESRRVRVECCDDGRYWHEPEGAVHLRTMFGSVITASLKVTRAFALEGPMPRVETAQVRFPPTVVGGTTRATLTARNVGRQTLRLALENREGNVKLAASEEAEIGVSLGPPDTARARRLQGHLLIKTNGPLPFLRYLSVPYTADVVDARVETTEFPFGDMRYRDQRAMQVKVNRSDRRRGNLVLDLPPALQGTLRLNGDLLYFRNLRVEPLAVDDTFALRDLDLDGAVLGQIHIAGRCLVPKLEVQLPEPVKVVPGEHREVRIRLVDAGGGLEIGRVTVGQLWASARLEDLILTIVAETDPLERGEKRLPFTIHSNDFLNPVQEHALVFLLTPTLWMKVQDRVRQILAPAIRVYRTILHTLRKRRWPV